MADKTSAVKKMFLVLLKKEFLVQVKTARFGVALVATLALMLVSLSVRTSLYQEKKQAHDADQAVHLSDVKGKPTYLVIASMGMDFNPPVLSAEIFAAGISGGPLETVNVNLDTVPETFAQRAMDPRIILQPTPDLCFIAATLLTLFAFVLCHDAVAGERESGTLKLLMSYSVPRPTLILAKAAAGYATLVVVMTVSLLVALIVLRLVERQVLSPQDWAAFGVAVLGSMAYLAVVCCLALLVSVRSRRSATAIVFLLLLWMVFFVAVPSISPYLAEALHPTPPFDDTLRKIFQASGDAFSVFQKERTALRQQIAAAQQAGDDKALAAAREQLQAADENLRRTSSKKTIEISRQYDLGRLAQARLAQNISRLSPVSSLFFVATDAAGTGLDQYFYFKEALNRYQQDFTEYLLGKMRASLQAGLPDPAAPPQVDLSDMPLPDQSYTVQPLRERLVATWLDMAMLLIEAVLLFMVGYALFMRMELV